jgi:hypothetical protein
MMTLFAPFAMYHYMTGILQMIKKHFVCLVLIDSMTNVFENGSAITRNALCVD